ncbi:protein CBFA2T3 isoform X4 [Gopherus flavomarginatus]|uniref:protein CBFA2T3 isoform X4 n=1 Tax=Gopherus flavomarginatus TaxID=286002 RepID=UPI0021CB9AC0|nr:protein CBFA2T3 isoform X4 [Gopherus flavomarginatus]
MAPGEGAPGEPAKRTASNRSDGGSSAAELPNGSAEKKKAATMPDSPADVKTQSRSTPPNMPPPPPAVTQGATRHPSFTPNTIMNGSSHSPTAINGAPSTPNGFSNGPATSSTASLSTHQLPPACGARQLSKLKRFLTTLQQFGNDISPEIGERVRTLVLGLVNSTLTIEEFHSKLQEATNFPLRPFVIPFLKANLPLLQRELLHCARMAKQTPAQYLAQHEQLLLDANASSPIDSSELLLEVTETGKRRTPDRTKENGLDRDPLHPEHLSKRPCTMSPAQRYSPSNGLSHQPNGLPHPTPPPPPHYRLEDMAMAHHYRDTYRHPDPRELRERHRQVAMHGSRQEEVIDHRLTDREWAEEWKHLNNLLNCIMDMVEKTRRSLTVLRRCQEADREELNHWIRRYSDAEDMKKGTNPPPRPHNSSSNSEAPTLDAHREFVPRPLSGYMPEEIWRKAEEAVNEVKRQAMSELQKAVSDAERKAHELITTERAKMERALAEAKRQASEDALSVINQQEDSKLLELRAQGQRDLQRMQHGPLLRLLLPAQGLGEAPPRLWADSAGPPGLRRRNPFLRGGLRSGLSSTGCGGCQHLHHQRGHHGRQPQRNWLGCCFALRHASHPSSSGNGITLTDRPASQQRGKKQRNLQNVTAATASLQKKN